MQDAMRVPHGRGIEHLGVILFLKDKQGTVIGKNCLVDQ